MQSDMVCVRILLVIMQTLQEWLGLLGHWSAVSWPTSGLQAFFSCVGRQLISWECPGQVLQNWTRLPYRSIRLLYRYIRLPYI